MKLTEIIRACALYFFKFYQKEAIQKLSKTFCLKSSLNSRDIQFDFFSSFPQSPDLKSQMKLVA